MSEFKLTIVTPNGIFYDDAAEAIIIRTISGNVGILKGHAPYAAALGSGDARVQIRNTWQPAICTGGILFADESEVKIAAKSFQWLDKTD